MAVPFWASSIEANLAELGTRTDGLTQVEADRRLLQFGPNRTSDTRTLTPLGLLLNQFRSPLVILLLFAMTLSLFLGETTDGVIVLAIVLGSALLGFWQEYRASNAVARLLAVIQTTVRVLRDGHEIELPQDALVPGDVIVLAAGAAVPADCRILRSTDLFVDESTLTGESYPAEKSVGDLPDDTPLAKRSNALFQGSHVVSGTGRAVVVQTGAQTVFGEIAEQLRLRPPETEFERGLRHFGGMLIQITMLLVIAIFGINVYLHRPVVDSFLFALALAVGLTPELLPAIVSITLARGAQLMAASHVIVRRLNSIEDFGSMNVLCSDKTGTLTEGVVKLHAALGVDGDPSDRVLLYAVLNATFESGFPNPIDEALRGQPCPDLAAYVKVDEVPYDFIRKRLSVVVERPSAVRRRAPAHDDHQGRAAERARGLRRCGGAERPGAARSVPIAEVRAALQERFEAYSEQGYRVLGVAVRDVTGDPIINKDDEQQMTFIGFLLLEDPPKADALAAITELRQLGVRAEDHHRGQPPRRRQDRSPDGGGATDRAHRRGAAPLERYRAAATGGRGGHLRGDGAEPEGADPGGAPQGRQRGRLPGRRDQRRERAPYGRRGDLGGERGGRRQGGGRHRAAAAGPGRPRARRPDGPADVRQHAQVRLHHDQRELRQHGEHGGRVALPSVPAAPAEADPAQQLPVRRSLDDHCHRPRGPRAGRTAAAVGHPIHPELHAGVRPGELRVRLPDVRRAALSGCGRRSDSSRPAGSSSRS